MVNNRSGLKKIIYWFLLILIAPKTFAMSNEYCSLYNCNYVGDNLVNTDDVSVDVNASTERTFNTSIGYKNDYYISSTNDVCIKINFARAMKVDFSTWKNNPTVKDSYIYLLSKKPGSAETSEGYYNISNYNLIQQGADSMSIDSIAAGTYYLVFEGKNMNGNMKMTIKGSYIPPRGDIMSKPLIITPQNNSKPYDFSYTDTENTSTSFANNYGTSAKDVYYKLSIPDSIGSMDVSISTCGSSIDTHLSLLDAAGNLIENNDDYTGDNCCASNSKNAMIYRTLGSGIYYIVSEGYEDNGEIITTITGRISEKQTSSSSQIITVPGGDITDPNEYSSIDGKMLKYGKMYTESFNTEMSNSTYNPYNRYLTTKTTTVSFVLADTMEVSMSTCGSDIDAYMTLAKNPGNVYLADCDDVLSGLDLEFGYAPCSDGSQAEITRVLPPGSYDIVLQGSDYDETGTNNGLIQLVIQTKRRNSSLMDAFQHPINVDIIDNLSYFTEAKNTHEFRDVYGKCLYLNSSDGVESSQYGGGAGDIIYNFHVSTPKQFSIYTTSSYSWIQLFDANKNKINTGIVNWISDPELDVSLPNKYTITLPAGEYYLLATRLNNKEGDVMITMDNLTEQAQVQANAVITTDPIVNSTKNYIKSVTLTSAVSGSVTVSSSNSNTEVKYFDGIGRAIQTVKREITPGKQDLVTFTEYDTAGREYRNWLPTTSTGSGAYVDPTNITGKMTSLYGVDTKPYLQTDYEASPLNCITSQWGAGQDWRTAGRSNQIDYQTNNANDVILYQMNGDNLKNAGYYGAAQLNVTKSTDEENHEVYEFKNKQGQVILKRAMAEAGAHNTYYVYDDLGSLRYVLSPEASDRMKTQKVYIQNWRNTPDNPLDQYAYIYKYDYRNRCVAKKLPGVKWIYMVYDNADRLVLSQDGNQRTMNTCYMTKYDVLGRVIQTGILSNLGDSLQSAYPFYKDKTVTETFVQNSGYTNTSNLLPSGCDFSVQTQSFYDTYDFLNLPVYSTNKSNLTYAAQSGYDEKYDYAINDKDYSAKGLMTGTVVAMLDNSVVLLTASYYDDKGRVVQSLSNNHLGGYDKEYLAYNFIGQPLKKRHVHKAFSNPEIIEDYTCNYDHAGRQLSTTHSINGKTPIQLDAMVYNELGQLSKKILHNGIQTIDYSYNVRGWLKSINSSEFKETLYYQDGATAGATPAYNGNISAQQWRHKNTNYALCQYTYTYDKLNRMKLAEYSPDYSYSEEIGLYDKNGNIKRLEREGLIEDGSLASIIDDLTLEYNGNQLKNVSDANIDQEYNYCENDFVDQTDDNNPIEYNYDANGNMTADLNKGIAWIKYNSLNLPQKVQFRNRNKIEYLYDASGAKQKAIYTTAIPGIEIPLGATTIENQNVSKTNTTEYCGNYIYEDGVLKRILTSEGFIQTDGTSSYLNWRHTYFLKDHLGNTRVQLVCNTLSNPASTAYTVGGRTDYYPFGLEITPLGGITSGTNPYLYNGKEMDRMHGLNMLDYGARWYDPTIGSFGTQDRFSEKYYSLSIYQYAGNNPVNFIDVNGDSIWISDGSERVLYTAGMEYKGDNKFISTCVNTLNQMGSVKIGDMVLDDLSSSTNNFTFSNTFYTKDGLEYKDRLAFIKNDGGGGLINAAMITNRSSLDNLVDASHELFHAYQYEKGGTQNSVFSLENEVEANLFGRAVYANYVLNNNMGYANMNWGINTDAGITYNNAMNSLLYGQQFNANIFQTAVTNFKSGSIKNLPVNGIRPYTNGQSNPNYVNKLIEKFIPLLR